MKKYYYYMYIGASLKDLAKESIRFVVRTKKPAYEYENLMEGNVHAIMKESSIHHEEVGGELQEWCNPFRKYDGINSEGVWFPQFVEVTKEYVDETFPIIQHEKVYIEFRKDAYNILPVHEEEAYLNNVNTLSLARLDDALTIMSSHMFLNSVQARTHGLVMNILQNRND